MPSVQKRGAYCAGVRSRRAVSRAQVILGAGPPRGVRWFKPSPISRTRLLSRAVGSSVVIAQAGVGRLTVADCSAAIPEACMLANTESRKSK